MIIIYFWSQNFHDAFLWLDDIFFSFSFDENELFGEPIDETINEPTPSNEPTGLDNCNEITLFENPNVNELEDILTSSISPRQNQDICDNSLDNIPLTEPAAAQSVLQIIPDNVPNGNLLLLKIPENMQNDAMLDEMMDIQLDHSTLDQINAAINENDGIFLKKSFQQKDKNTENQQPMMVRRQPLQLVQQIIKYPTVKNVKTNNHVESKEKKKENRKRKQLFFYPREDKVEFYR